jgi:phenylacetate-CoA ligase
VSVEPALPSALAALALTSRSDRAALARRRDRAVARVVAHAYAQVPYYRALLDAHGVRPETIRGAADLARIPPTARATLQALPPAEAVAAGARGERLIAAPTSGSSGRPLVVQRTWLEQNLLHLFRLRAERALGVRLTDRRVRVGAPSRYGGKDPKRLGRALRRAGLLRMTHLSVFDDPHETLARVRALAPDVLGGYPSGLARLADAAERTGLAPLRPRLVVTGAERLAPAVRARLGAAFGAPVRELYGCTEANLLAAECPAGGRLHTIDDAVVVEVLAGDRPARPGEQGEVVITALHSYAMPIIRYRIGDLARVGESGCACGTSFGTLDGVDGRAIDLFHLPDGRTLHPFRLTTEGIEPAAPWVRHYQVVQEAVDRFTVRVVPGAERPGAAQLAALRAALGVHLGPAVDVALLVVDRIESEASGKCRDSWSLVREPATGAAVGAA